MLSHATARDWLIPYADGMLAQDERAPIDAHLAGCSSCAAELGEVRELNLLLVSLPPAPPVRFAPFWSELQAALPRPRVVRAPREAGYRRLGLAFAVATVAVIASMGAAFAAPSALPDNPLYPVKQLEEGVRLALTPADGRLSVQVELAAERLSEAQAMAANHQPVLAMNSLRSFDVLLGDASAELTHPADPRVATADLHRLRTDLDAVEEANASRGDDDSNVKQSVLSSIGEVDRVEQEEKQNTTAPVIVTTPTPTPTPTPRPTERETPRPSPTSDSGDRDQRTEAH
jgi:Domain of unknown function (DUF5667)/Putative zinc-finger